MKFCRSFLLGWLMPGTFKDEVVSIVSLGIVNAGNV